MSKYETITEVEKNIDEIIEVEKFNPFHDSQGKFSNSHGFASYSANPNTKAGAMAIARSAAAGHGATANVHRESYGENIRQNANWLGRGKQQSPRQQGNATLRNRVEPIGGLAGASAVGSSWQHQNQQQGRTTQPGKQPQQQAKQPAQKPQQPQKPAATKQPQQQQQPQQKPKASDRQPVDGKDISKTFKYDPNAKGSALDQVTEQQGYKGKPTVVKDRAEFSAAVKASGVMAYRTVNSGRDVVTGKTKSADDFVNDMKNADTISHNGSGGQVYGGGIYIAATPSPRKGVAPSRSNTDAAKRDSQCYGSGSSKTMAMTLSPSAKVGDYNTVRSEYNRLTTSQRQKYGRDMATYAASKGYDALRATNAGWNCDYVMVYNRTKLVIFDG